MALKQYFLHSFHFLREREVGVAASVICCLLASCRRSHQCGRACPGTALPVLLPSAAPSSNYLLNCTQVCLSKGTRAFREEPTHGEDRADDQGTYTDKQRRAQEL